MSEGVAWNVRRRYRSRCDMPLRKIGRQPGSLGALALFAALDVTEPSRHIQDVQHQLDVVAQVRLGLSETLGMESILHGWRVQALFEAVVVELGTVQLIKTEDEGDCYFASESDKAEVKLPDFRIVREDDEVIVVEVKNVAPGKTSTKMKVGELDALATYAALTRARPVVAHYWAAANMWTAVDASVLKRRHGYASVDIGSAMKANEMVLLGDSMLATSAPLALRLTADPRAPSTLAPEVDGTRLAEFVIGAVSVLGPRGEIVAEEERRLALFMMFYGGWDLHTVPIVEDESLVAVDHIFEPMAPPEEDESLRAIEPAPFANAGFLSSMYSAMYNVATLDDDGSVRRLRHEPQPGALRKLVPEDYWEREDRVLELWRFQMQPSEGPAASGTHGQAPSGSA